MVKINKITPPIAELFDPNHNSLGFVENELELNDVRIQIMNQQLEGYYFKFNNNIIPVYPSGKIDNWVTGFYDQQEQQLATLFRFGRKQKTTL